MHEIAQHRPRGIAIIVHIPKFRPDSGKDAKCPPSQDQSAHERELARQERKCMGSAADDVYELAQHRPRGFAVIVNITKGRPGSEKDVSMMVDLFSQLRYEVMTFIDVTKEVCIAIALGLPSNLA